MDPKLLKMGYMTLTRPLHGQFIFLWPVLETIHLHIKMKCPFYLCQR